MGRYVGDGSSTTFGGEYRQGANVLVELGTKQFTGDGLSLHAGWILYHVLHVDLKHAQQQQWQHCRNTSPSA